MTPEERKTLAEAMANHGRMVQLYVDVWEARSGTYIKERKPKMGDIFRVGGEAVRLRKKLAAFVGRESQGEYGAILRIAGNGVVLAQIGLGLQ